MASVGQFSAGFAVITITLMLLQISMFLRSEHRHGVRQHLEDKKIEFVYRMNFTELKIIPSQNRSITRTAGRLKEERMQKRYLTIGIPTIWRPRTYYLWYTIDSLLNATSNSQLLQIYIVIFLADFNTTWKEITSKDIKRRYKALVSNNTIQIITAPYSFYPPLDNLKQTFNDSESRMKWRSKQNIDYAYLWLYSKNISKYYIQIEDDVKTSPTYFAAIKQFISNQKLPWVCLEFCQHGFIGKLFHSHDLQKLAKYIVLFYAEQPIDYLLRYFNFIHLQDTKRERKPNVFHHVGLYSSLKEKMAYVNPRFLDTKKSLKGQNPKAELYTTMTSLPKFDLKAAYSVYNGYFWSNSPPVMNDSIYVIFKRPQSIKSVIIMTGSKEHPNDKLEHAQLNACKSCRLVGKNRIICHDTYLLGRFNNGSVVANDVRKKYNLKLFGCLRLTVTKSQTSCLIIKEIAVFLR
ncbi:alpha-1,3-mannosyl-glycoprotein 4-beta-N-acetylglucosaminyltransferase C-like [Mytilus galloprovincialis]|uniref:alpha-1,3-mannosyl-glycoprotein 4-beta-N-acetylglucosaminyltransferase C-like n=1 Tax=Mytilus galloprovincialis TaxID=29158 RepID=UPI003F7CB8CC